MVDVVLHSTALAFVTKIREKRKSALPCAVQVKNGQKTVGTEKTLM